jgi:Serpentine type 7TM GPCR chemoreceptor Srw
VCIFGVVTNVLNFIVLTQKDLRTNINYILAALAISDFLVMLIYIPYSADYGFNMKSKYERLTFSYACYVFSHAVLSQIAHTVSIFLTIMLALWRYIAVCHPNKKNLVMKQTIPAIIASYFISPLISIPIYMSLNIKELNITVNSNETINESLYGNEVNLTIYKVWPSELAANHEMMYLWVYSVIIKLLPCITLTFLSLQLIHALYEAKKRKEKLTGNISVKLLRKKKQADRTTKMLIAVLLLFLLTEFPQGIMGLFSAVLHRDFYHYCYQKMGECKFKL